MQKKDFLDVVIEEYKLGITNYRTFINDIIRSIDSIYSNEEDRTKEYIEEMCKYLKENADDSVVEDLVKALEARKLQYQMAIERYSEYTDILKSV